jgi:integrase
MFLRMLAPMSSGDTRHRVEFRLGGRETRTQYGGSFRTLREARERQRWITGELAARRIPDLSAVADPVQAPTLTVAAEAWLASRLDAAEATKAQHRTSINRCTRVLGSKRIDMITPQDVAAMVGTLHDGGTARESIRKSLNAMSMCLGFHGIEPNPARDKVHVKLPRADIAELTPPTCEHVLAVHRLLPERYRLPLLVLDATGMRVGELAGLAWGDVDEPRGRWRVSAAVTKTRSARWVIVPPVVFDAVCRLVPRDDRVADRPVFQGFGADRFRTAITRACVAAGVPTFSPHDLRHRRISLLHLGGVPWARIGEQVGQRDLSTTANTYSHVLPDETEIAYAELLAQPAEAAKSEVGTKVGTR